MRPMLATPAAVPPRGDRWRHEVKWDGMRVLVDVRDHQVRLTSRTERDVTIAFPELVGTSSRLAEHEDLLLDGEVVAMKQGRPDFATLAERFNVTNARVAQELAAAAPITFMAFDVLRVMGHDVTRRPWTERRSLLEATGLDGEIVQVPPVFEDGPGLLAATAEQQLEGIVSKRVDAAYRPGARSESWLKVVHRTTGSFVVGGWRPETGSAGRLGAVLLGTPTPHGTTYRGRIGSGLAGRAGAQLLPRLRELECDDVPFTDDVPAEDRRGTTWVRPELVVDVEYHGHAPGGRLRQPSWKGVRPDLTVDDLVGQEHP